MVSVSGKVGPRTTPPLGFVSKAEALPMQALWGGRRRVAHSQRQFRYGQGKESRPGRQAKDYI